MKKMKDYQGNPFILNLKTLLILITYADFFTWLILLSSIYYLVVLTRVMEYGG